MRPWGLLDVWGLLGTGAVLLTQVGRVGNGLQVLGRRCWEISRWGRPEDMGGALSAQLRDGMVLLLGLVGLMLLGWLAGSLIGVLLGRRWGPGPGASG